MVGRALTLNATTVHTFLIQPANKPEVLCRMEVPIVYSIPKVSSEVEMLQFQFQRKLSSSKVLGTLGELPVVAHFPENGVKAKEVPSIDKRFVSTVGLNVLHGCYFRVYYPNACTDVLSLKVAEKIQVLRFLCALDKFPAEFSPIFTLRNLVVQVQYGSMTLRYEKRVQEAVCMIR